MQNTDYQKQLEIILTSIKNYNEENKLDNANSKVSLLKKPTLLLHACCAPCSSYVIEYLSDYFDITIFYYNPNIHPESEYTRRLQELKTFLNSFPKAKTNNVKLVTPPYNPEDFFTATDVKNNPELQTEKEKGERCRRCYLLRMRKAYEFAKANSFDFFTTTLSISPYKDSSMINKIGFQLEAEENNLPATKEATSTKSIKIKSKTSKSLSPITKEISIQKIIYISNTGLHYLPADFKKNSGFLRSLELSKEYNLYRQDYCGCIYSKQNMNKENG
ncbi:MAG: epoxyqueuosine reductase QueH [Treponema sp.]